MYCLWYYDFDINYDEVTLTLILRILAQGDLLWGFLVGLTEFQW